MQRGGSSTDYDSPQRTVLRIRLSFSLYLPACFIVCELSPHQEQLLALIPKLQLPPRKLHRQLHLVTLYMKRMPTLCSAGYTNVIT